MAKIVIPQRPLPEYVGRAYKIESFTTPGTHYLVVVGPDWDACTCPSFIKARQVCKHIHHVRQVLDRKRKR